jgi:hypothetical protein
MDADRHQATGGASMSSYGGYIERLARKVEARLQDIEAIYNFDLGDEFEVAICAFLKDTHEEANTNDQHAGNRKGIVAF